MRKLKRSRSEYYNCESFSVMVLLALVDAEYSFLSVDVGSSGSSSDAQILNHSKMKKKIEDGTLGLLAP